MIPEDLQWNKAPADLHPRIAEEREKSVHFFLFFLAGFIFKVFYEVENFSFFSFLQVIYLLNYYFSQTHSIPPLIC